MTKPLRGFLLALAFLLTGLAPALAQAQGVRVGVRAGPTFAFLSDSALPFSGGNPDTNANLRLDIQAGAFVVVPLTEKFALQPELRFLQKGGHFSQPWTQRYTVERYRLSYLQGAFLGRRDLSISGPLSAHLVAGLSLDRALGGVVQRNVRTAKKDVADRIELGERDRLQRWDIGGIVGAGLGYPVGAAGRVSLTVRYNPGFRSAFSSAGRAPPSPPNDLDLFPLPRPVSALRHDVITASFSYTMPL